jgi:hypothetical protein
MMSRRDQSTDVWLMGTCVAIQKHGASTGHYRSRQAWGQIFFVIGDGVAHEAKRARSD